VYSQLLSWWLEKRVCLAAPIIMMSQNRSSRVDRIREDDLHDKVKTVSLVVSDGCCGVVSNITFCFTFLGWLLCVLVGFKCFDCTFLRWLLCVLVGFVNVLIARFLDGCCAFWLVSMIVVRVGWFRMHELVCLLLPVHSCRVADI
jgi:hypothetical protein